MIQEDLDKIIQYLVDEGIKLKDKYIAEDLVVDYIAIFSHSDQEYEDLKRLASERGEVAEDTPSGPVYKFSKRPQTKAGQPYFLKIRIPDSTRTERGDIDLNTKYPEFKKKYLGNKRFSLVVRKDFEMIELMDSQFNVRVYFSNEPLSKRLGIS